MTPNLSHVAGLQFALDTHIIGDLRARQQVEEIIQQANSAPAEPVSREAVAWRVTGRGGITVTGQYPEWAEADCLLTITPLYTAPPSPDAELVELLRSKFPRIDPCQPVPLDEKAYCCEYSIYAERERLHRLIDAKLASLVPKESV